MRARGRRIVVLLIRWHSLVILTNIVAAVRNASPFEVAGCIQSGWDFANQHVFVGAVAPFAAMRPGLSMINWSNLVRV